ncbi:uncharacterized protein [Elaeis guineensis]|uniref:Poly [ADP-ribose] polymerase tankyrase isoform X2 n=1 Tax=Elaeis guineensis var. tenera TaxID=51953 RepID=A0A6I9R7J4_ELAGV|nr:poly [ADP-ribose] polymerase tankyrase isoform X2 [Elaeis guineensis]
MAVPGRRNGLMDDEEDEEGLFDEVEGEAWADLQRDVPPHLRALVDAAQRGNVDALRLALDNHNGSIDDPVEDGDTVLHLSCLYGYLPCVQLLLQRGANLESKDEEGAIPLHDACAGGFTDIVQYIINFAGSPECVERMLNTTDAEGDTPLHHAARGEHLDVIRLLLAAGACPKKTNAYEKTPAELASQDTEVQSVLTAAAASAPDAVCCQ